MMRLDARGHDSTTVFVNREDSGRSRASEIRSGDIPVAGHRSDATGKRQAGDLHCHGSGVVPAIFLW